MAVIWYMLTLLIAINQDAHARNYKNNNSMLPNDFLFNMSHIVLQSVLFCGPNIICDKSLLTLLDIPKISESDSTRCGKCSCNDNCVRLQNCCPDIFFKHGLRECKNVKVLSKGPSLDKRDIIREVVASCPIGTDLTLSGKCTKDRFDLDALLNPPVASDITMVSYRNKYCAICNKATYWKEWSVKFQCKSITDFNFLSSYQEMIDLVYEEECRIIPSPPAPLSDCDFDLNGKIISCNVTESWHNYDEQVEQACLSTYVHPMGIFKNIFCAICNPPKFHEEFLVDHCENTTSVNKTACTILPFLEASFPYKNYFCFACKQGFNNTVFFADVDVEWTSESYNKNYEYPFQFTISFAYNYTSLNNYIDQYFGTSNADHKTLPLFTEHYKHRTDQVECSPKSDNMLPPMGQGNFHAPRFPPFLRPFLSYMKDSSSIIGVPPTNITNLIRKSFAFSRHGACTPGLLPNYTMPMQKQCSCTMGCRSDCCDDFALKVPWTCIDDHYFRDGNSNDYLAIGGCIDDKYLEDLCMSNVSLQIYHLFPLTSNTGYKETYVNVFCYLCNKNFNHKKQTTITGNFTQEIELWPLKVECKTFVNYRNFHSLQNLIAYFNRRSCVLRFLPHISASKCSDACYEDEVNTIVRCNVSGTWDNFDDDVIKACENMGTYIFPPIEVDNIVYKNKFCKICNPFQATQLRNNCSSVPEDSNDNVVKACQEFPIINACFPFENVFCEMCMNNISESQCYQEVKNKEDSRTILPVFPGPFFTTPSLPRPLPEELGTFRSSFSLRSYDTPSIVNEEEKLATCQHKQILNEFKQTSWNLTCFPGKLLRNERCVSLLPMTSNLRYTLAVKIELSTFILINATVQKSLEGMKEYVTTKMKQLLRTDFFIEDITLMSSVSCDDMFFNVSEVYLYLVIFIDKNVYRDQLEQKLINFTESSFIWNLSNNSALIGNTIELNIHMYRMVQPVLKSTLMSNLMRRNHCFVANVEEDYLASMFANVIVSPLLTCPQVLLKENETGLDWGNTLTENTFLSLAPSFHHTSDNDEIRVCAGSISYIKELKSKELDDNFSSLTIVTLICIIVSLLCLIVTLVTYCMFPSLRTLPGINNMFLVASLFLAQFLMIVRPCFHSSSLVAASVLSHFSWLSTFLWLQVCSFHMFRVFSAKGRSKFLGGKGRKLIVQYVLYAFGVSLFIVTSNVSISLIVTDGENTGYDKMSTLMTYKIAFITTLVTPIAFVSVTNIVFYTFTAYKIYSSPKIENTAGNRIHFGVYVKLFTLTGLSWILQMVDMFLELSAFSYFVAILNGLQGLFIFVSYVCNRRVWKLYVTSCGTDTVYRFVSSSKTDTTTM